MKCILPILLLLAGCAGFGDRPGSAAGGVDLGPGGRAEGRLVVPAGGEARLRLENRGPGRVDHAIRTDTGRVVSEGALGTSEFKTRTDSMDVYVIVLESYADAGARVDVGLEGRQGYELNWDLSRAHPR